MKQKDLSDKKVFDASTTLSVPSTSSGPRTKSRGNPERASAFKPRRVEWVDFSGKTALVTGGTRGIGRAIASLLADSGCKVIYTGTKKSAPESSVKGCYWSLDLSDNSSIGDFLEKMKGFSKLDIVVNNAGINTIESIDELKQKHWDKIIQVNLTGAMLIMKEAAKIMKPNPGGGRIVNVSSVFGILSKAKRGSYSASKAGLIGLTRATALDLAPYNILVNALCPGFTKTDLTAAILSEKDISKLSFQIPLGRFAHEEEIAKAAVFLCSPFNSYMTGQLFIVDGGFTAL